jgi:pimeloyl-ACP methyl ester carboxylesterase
LIVHDWSSALGFDWARRHPGAVRAIAYMEAIITTLQSWDQWAESSRELFQAFRSDRGEDMILEHNVFVEQVLPAGILRTLDDEEMAEYRRRTGNRARAGCHTGLAAADPCPRRARGRHAGRRGVPAVAGGNTGDPQALRERRTGYDPARPAARGLPDLAEPDRDHRPRPPPRAGELRH